MAALHVLEFPETRIAPRSKGRALNRRLIPMAILLTAVIAALAFAALRVLPVRQQPAPIAAGPSQAELVEHLNADDHSQLLVEGELAQERNALIPFATGAVGKVEKFVLPATAAGEANAVRCLAQAVYYEAGYEPIEGRRAVAQVVLNRVRHPAYPKSVCGVVYEGAQLRTGCQFSFTCDGSLLRTPAPGAWREAVQVARKALAGFVDKGVGTATHYHADYVLPRWAFELAKIEQVGRHIFYRFDGAWGRSSAFNGHYSGLEVIPTIDFGKLRDRIALGAPVTEPEEYVPGLTVTPDVADRHAKADVGGRLDVTKQWRLSIPDPTEASSRYNGLVQPDAEAPPAIAASGSGSLAIQQ